MTFEESHNIRTQNARESLHRQYKQAGLTDYFVTSLERTAKGIVDAAKEALALDIKTKEQQAVRIAEKINRKKVQLKPGRKRKSVAGGPEPGPQEWRHRTALRESFWQIRYQEGHEGGLVLYRGQRPR